MPRRKNTLIKIINNKKIKKKILNIKRNRVRKTYFIKGSFRHLREVLVWGNVD